MGLEKYSRIEHLRISCALACMGPWVGEALSHIRRGLMHITWRPSPLVYKPQSLPPTSTHTIHCALVRDEPGEKTPGRS